MRRTQLPATVLLVLACAALPALGADCKLALVAEWPVRLEGGLPLVEGAINGQKVSVLVDTGAVVSGIPKSVADRFGLQRQPIGIPVGPAGERIAQIGEGVQIDEFGIGKTARKNWRVFAIDDQGLGAGAGFILGNDFFEKSDLELDYAGGFVRLFQPQQCEGIGLAYWSRQGAGVVDIEASHKIYFPARVNGTAIRAILDTGATKSMLHVLIAKSLGVSPGAPGVVETRCRGAGGESAEESIGFFDSIAIGDETIRNPKLALSDLWKFNAYIEVDASSRTPKPLSGQATLVIGADFLRTHRVYVARSQRKLYFTYIGGAVFPLTPDSQCARRSNAGD